MSSNHFLLVGLAIAGEGGVASSKPVATAVVGPGGLAVGKITNQICGKLLRESNVFELSARPVATAIAGVKPSDISALGLPIPSKLKDLAARDGAFPLKGKYGLVSLSDGVSEDKVLVGPSYYAQARLKAEKDLNSESEESDEAEIDDIDSNDRESFRRPGSDQNKEDSSDRFDKNGSDERQVEPVENSESPYGFEFEKQPIFQPTYEGFYNVLPNPFLPPYNFNLPYPLINQYLQRRSSFNAGRYAPQAVPQYPSTFARQQYNPQYNPNAYSPFTRLLYVQ